MPKKSKRIEFNFHIPEYTQISESHCGPAVIQMLLGNLGIPVTQEEVAEAGGATDLIELNGMRVDQLAEAVQHLAPQSQFWWKEGAKMRELVSLVNKFHYPVGVEWQGLFEDDDDIVEDEESTDDDSSNQEAETGEDDYGHYSIVSHVDKKKNLLIIVDPYKDFAMQDRIFSFEEFKERWYDFNEIIDPITGEKKYVEDYHMMFIITLKNETFPKELGMKRGEKKRIT